MNFRGRIEGLEATDAGNYEPPVAVAVLGSGGIMTWTNEW
jgi:hypothetical protein